MAPRTSTDTGNMEEIVIWGTRPLHSPALGWLGNIGNFFFGWVDGPARGESDAQIAAEMLRAPLAAVPVGRVLEVTGTAAKIVYEGVTQVPGKVVLVGTMQVGANAIGTTADIVAVEGAQTAAEAFQVVSEIRYGADIESGAELILWH